MDIFIGLGFFLYLQLACFGLGSAVTGLLPRKDKGTSRYFLVSSLGLATSGILTTLGYFAGLSLFSIFIFVTGVAAAGLVRALNAREKAPHASLLSRPELGVLLAALLLMLCPHLIGGLQFSLFEGNHYDTYNYLESAATYARLPKALIGRASGLALYVDGGYPSARWNLHYRPTVSILFGCLQFAAPRHFLGDHYLLLVYAMFIAGGLLYYLCQAAAPAAPRWMCMLCAMSVVVGYWGQYLIDINSWSQVLWLPAELAFVLMWLELCLAGQTSETKHERRWRSLRDSVLCALCFTGAYYFYPEGTLFLLPALGMATFLLIRRGNWSRITTAFFAVGSLSMLAVVPVWECCVEYIVTAYTMATAPVDWWKYFQAPLFGMEGLGAGTLRRIVDGGTGAVGAYFLTPRSGTPAPLAALWRLALVIWLAALGVGSIKSAFSRGSSWMARSLSVATIFCIAECAVLFFQEHYWTAGKGLSYIAPIYAAMLSLSIAGSYGNRPARKALWLCAPCLLIGANVAFGAARVYQAAAQRSGIVYAKPYPAIQSELLKTTFDFGDVSFLRGLTKRDYVAIKIENPWIESYVQMMCLAQRIPFYFDLPRHAYHHPETVIGFTVPTKAPTVRLTLALDRSKPFPSFLAVEHLAGAQN